MATTAAGGIGGGPPPPDGGNNGNLTGVNGLVESISDVNLTLLQESNKFLSAKNSVELHKVKGRRFNNPNRSLPSFLLDEPVEDEELDGGFYSPEDEGPVQIEPETSPVRNVNWSDLHAATGHVVLKRQSHQNSKISSDLRNYDWNDDSRDLESEASFPSTVPAGRVNETSSHTSLYLQSPDPLDISVLHVRPGSRPFSLIESTGNLELGEGFVQNSDNFQDPSGNGGGEITEVSDRDLQLRNLLQQQQQQQQQQTQRQAPETASPTFPMMIGGSPDSTSDQPENLRESISTTHVINQDDGLGNMGFRTPIFEDTPMRSVFYTPITDSVSHLQGSKCLDSAYYEEAVLAATLPPIPTESIGEHLEEQFTPRAAIMSPPEDKQSFDTYYDGDDDVDWDKKTEFKMPCVDDIPVPDPSYVAATVSESLRPLIAKTYKKDCRTWLWKSKAQREAALRQQAEDEKLTAGDTSDSGPDSSAHAELTKKMSRLDFKT